MNFVNSDIVVWNGIITEYHIIKRLLRSSDEIRFADDLELDLYFKIN